MLNSYLEDEVRDGFYIPSMVKRAWATALDVLSEVDRICEKHNIKYYAEWGTLLGAIRHAGFIPWDDDLDIAMRRTDYEKFVEVSAKEFSEGFEIFTFKNHKDYHHFVARVVCKNRICFEDEHLRKYHGFPYIVGLDIFVHDNVCKDENRQKISEKTAEYVITVADKIADHMINNDMTYDSAKESLARINSLCKCNYNITMEDFNNSHKLEELRINLYGQAEKLFRSYEHEECDYMTQMMPYSMYGYHQRIPVKYYEKLIRVPFENTTIPVPIGFDAMLKNRYGDYMRLVKNAGGHDYPFYESQKKQLEALMDFKLPEYRMVIEDAVREETVECGETYSEGVLKNDGYRELLRSALTEMKKMCNEAADLTDAEVFAQKLTDVQQLAVDAGTLIDSIKGEGTEAVHQLEILCEVLFAVFNGSAGFDELVECMNITSDVIHRHIILRKEVVFMPIKAADWKYISKYYAECKQDAMTDVYVVVLPYMYKEYDGTIIESVYEGNEFPDNIVVTNYTEYNYQLHHPDEIVITCPFDNENKCITVPKEYYSNVIKKYCDKLIYVQSFEVEDFDKNNEREYKNMSSYVCVPGVVNADEAWVQSDKLRTMYIEKLTEFAGEDTRKLWGEKVKVNLHYMGEDAGVSYNGNDKKRILFYTSISGAVQNAEEFIQKIDSVFKVFHAYANNIEVVWCIQDVLNNSLRDVNEQLYAEFERVKANLAVQEDIQICSDKDEEIWKCCDAYYGDSSPMVQWFRNCKKPIMIINYRVN